MPSAVESDTVWPRPAIWSDQKRSGSVSGSWATRWSGATTTIAATTVRIAAHGARRRYQGAIGVMTGAVDAGRARAPMCGLAGGAPGRYRFAGLGATPATRAFGVSGTVGLAPLPLLARC